MLSIKSLLFFLFPVLQTGVGNQTEIDGKIEIGGQGLGAEQWGLHFSPVYLFWTVWPRSWSQLQPPPPPPPVCEGGDQTVDSVLQGPSWAAAAVSCLLTPIPPLLPVLVGETRLQPPHHTPYLFWSLILQTPPLPLPCPLVDDLIYLLSHTF